jgi:hypothetical protein
MDTMINCITCVYTSKIKSEYPCSKCHKFDQWEERTFSEKVQSVA